MNHKTFTIISIIAVIAAVSAYIFTLPSPASNNTQDDSLHTFNNNDQGKKTTNEVDNILNEDTHETILAQDKSGEFSLDFSLGGSIFGSTFTVRISDSTVLYQEFEHLTDEKEKLERTLSPEEIAEIKDTVIQLGILTLEQEPRDGRPDGVRYSVTVSLNGRENMVGCYKQLNPEERRNKCQENLDALRDKLNDILDVNMW